MTETHYAIRIGKPGVHHLYFMPGDNGEIALFSLRTKARAACPKRTQSNYAVVVKVEVTSKP